MNKFDELREWIRLKKAEAAHDMNGIYRILTLEQVEHEIDRLDNAEYNKSLAEAGY